MRIWNFGTPRDQAEPHEAARQLRVLCDNLLQVLANGEDYDRSVALFSQQVSLDEIVTSHEGGHTMTVREFLEAVQRAYASDIPAPVKPKTGADYKHRWEHQQNGTTRSLDPHNYQVRLRALRKATGFSVANVLGWTAWCGEDYLD